MFGWREVHGVGTHMENTQLAHGAAGSAGGEGFFIYLFSFFFAIGKKNKTGF